MSEGPQTTQTRPTGNGQPRPMSRLHLWQIQPIRDIAVILIIIAIVRLGYQMSVVTVPLLLGLLLAYLLEPPIAWFAHRTSRTVAAATAIALMALIVVVPVAGGVGIAITQGFQFASSLDDDLTKFVDKIERLLTYMERDSVKVVIDDKGKIGVEPGDDTEATDGEAPAKAKQPETNGGPPATSEDQPEPEPAPESTQDKPESAKPESADEPEPAESKTMMQRWATILRKGIQENVGELSQRVATGGLGAVQIGWVTLLWIGGAIFKYLFLTPFFFFFWSISLGSVKEFGARLIPYKHREHTLEVIGKMDRAIAAFIRGRFTIALILSVLYTVAYTLIGVPAPLIFGPVIGIASAVPYLPLLGWPATMLAMAVDQAGAADPYPWWWIVLGPTIVYFAFQTLDDYVLTPMIQGKNVGLSTPVILFAVLGAGALAGVYGVLIAIPIAACIKILITDVVFPRYKAWVEGKADDPLPISSHEDDQTPPPQGTTSTP